MYFGAISNSITFLHRLKKVLNLCWWGIQVSEVNKDKEFTVMTLRADFK